MIRHIATMIVAALFTVAAWAGPVVSPLGMAPGAVSSSGLLFSALAGVNGAFVLNGLPLSAYIVSAGHLPCEQPAEGEEAETPHAEEEHASKGAASDIELEKVSVTASRRPEKLIEAPASIAVIEGDHLRAQVAVNQAERLRHLPAVDVASSGIVQANTVVRGFNNVFSTTLLTLVDNRYARIPSLRLNAYSFIPSTDDDIERVEVVLGPGSALYGPNSANGVLHMLTRSPFDSVGTDISVGAGERGILMGSVRHAGAANEQLGYKLSAQYYQGDDWEYVDPVEQQARQALIDAGGNPDEIRVGARDYEVDKLSADARLDYRLSESATAILSGGFVQAKQIELTGVGASIADGWTYSYVQGRLTAGDLFAQAFINMSDAGDSFLLRDGAPIVDKSQIMVAQIQHGTTLGDRERLTYGIDALLTRPDTEGTINGMNEEDDNVNEIGVYLQSETELTEQLKLVAAARVDDHSRLADMIFSPRAALVFSPTSTDNLRVTYNRAYSTPSTNNLFLDIRVQQDPFGTGIDLRGSGIPESGFTFKRSENGDPMFRSPLAPLAGLAPDAYIPLHDPAFVNVMWGLARGVVIDGLIQNPQINALMAGALTNLGLPADEETMKTIAAGLVPEQVNGVNNNLLMFNANYNPLDPTSQPFLPTTGPIDVPAAEPTITQTVEFGYKGALFNSLVVSADVYHTNITNFVGPLTAETPSVFLDGATLSASLAQQLAETFSQPQNQPLAAALLALDGAYEEETKGAVAKNGSAVDEVAYLIASGAARIPLGTVTPDEASDPIAVMGTYRNYGDISLTGADLNLNLFLSENLAIGGTYSFVSENMFELEDDPHDVSLNAPKHKFGARIQYMNADLGALAAELRLRYVDEFPVNSGVYQGVVEQYQTLDLSAGYSVLDNTRLSLSVQNILDDKHIEFVGAPELGRLAIVRLTQSF